LKLLLLLLLLQDLFLRLWFASYLYGQLSWLQIARMHVSDLKMALFACRISLPGTLQMVQTVMFCLNLSVVMGY
jgi:hypothetical protein